jgi:hypothetical protein
MYTISNRINVGMYQCPAYHPSNISTRSWQHTMLSIMIYTYQMDDSGGRQPNRNEDGDQLGQADGTGCLENVKVLQDIRHCHQPQSTKKSKTYTQPSPQTKFVILSCFLKNCFTHRSNLNWADLTDPCPVQVDGHERGRYREVVDERVHLQHEPQFIAGGDELIIENIFQNEK